MMNGYGMGLLGLLVQVIFMGLIISFVYVLIRSLDKKKSNPSDEDSALKILNERFARDDITEDEYQRKKEMLKK